MDILEFYGSLPIHPGTDPIDLDVLDGYYLAAPDSFWRYLEDDQSAAVNGCGPKHLGDFLVPDTVWGLSVKPACKIHDWMYTVYNSEAGFKLSNTIFLDNMLRINASTKNVLLRYLRTRRIMKYYRMVNTFGRLFFYDAHVSLYNSGEIYR